MIAIRSKAPTMAAAALAWWSFAVFPLSSARISHSSARAAYVADADTPVFILLTGAFNRELHMCDDRRCIRKLCSYGVGGLLLTE